MQIIMDVRDHIYIFAYYSYYYYYYRYLGQCWMNKCSFLGGGRNWRAGRHKAFCTLPLQLTSGQESPAIYDKVCLANIQPVQTRSPVRLCSPSPSFITYLHSVMFAFSYFTGPCHVSGCWSPFSHCGGQ